MHTQSGPEISTEERRVVGVRGRKTPLLTESPSTPQRRRTGPRVDDPSRSLSVRLGVSVSRSSTSESSRRPTGHVPTWISSELLSHPAQWSRLHKSKDLQLFPPSPAGRVLSPRGGSGRVYEEVRSITDPSLLVVRVKLRSRDPNVQGQTLGTHYLSPSKPG